MLQDVAVPDIANNLGTAIVAAGALGTAAFGIVEGLKYLAVVGEAGFSSINSLLGGLTSALRVAYGANAEVVLRAQYRGDTRELKRLLRQGVRAGITPANAAALATSLGSIDPAALTAAVTNLASNRPISDGERATIGRYELAADARIDAALTAAQSAYAGTSRILAMVVALAIALGMATALNVSLLVGAMVGLAAVPLAPIAKDVASGINAAATALKGRK
jgi:hypothetical protein